MKKGRMERGNMEGGKGEKGEKGEKGKVGEEGRKDRGKTEEIHVKEKEKGKEEGGRRKNREVE